MLDQTCNLRVYDLIILIIFFLILMTISVLIASHINLILIS